MIKTMLVVSSSLLTIMLVTAMLGPIDAAERQLPQTHQKKVIVPNPDVDCPQIKMMAVCNARHDCYWGKQQIYYGMSNEAIAAIAKMPPSCQYK